MTLNIHSVTDCASAYHNCQKAVSDMLPNALARAISAYEALADKSDFGNDLKAYQAHQAACKAALQHIELLLKLSSASGADEPEGLDTGLDALMAEAKEELVTYQSNSSVRTGEGSL